MNRPASAARLQPQSGILVQPLPPWMKWGLALAWLALIGFVAFLWQLGQIGLIDETEPLFAEAARQMTVTGDWVTPYFNGDTRFDKPPLIYWLMAIAYQTVGVNAWATRLPSALAAIAMTGFGFYILRRFGQVPPGLDADASTTNPIALEPPLPPDDVDGVGQKQDPRWIAAWIGSGAMALNLQTIAWARSGVSDLLLTACITAALFGFFCGYAQPHRPRIQRMWYLSFYSFAALAVLAKGPVGIVIPGMIIVLFLLWVGKLWSVLKELQLGWGSALFFTITVPWYVLVIQAHGQTYINDFFGYHNVERFTSVVNNHAAPWYFYFLVVLLGFIPWSIYVPVAMGRLHLWRRSRWQQTPRHTHLGLFAGVWFVVVFGFFTIAITKLPSYTLPLLPAASIMVALLWSQQMTHPRRSIALMVSHGLNVLFLGLLAWAIFHSDRWLGDDPAMPDLPQLIQSANLLVVGGWIWAVGAIAAILLIVTRRTRWIWGTTLATFAAFLALVALPALPIMDSQRQLPLRQIAAEIVATSEPTAETIMVGFKKPTLVFYTQRPVHYIYGVNEAIAHLRSQGRIRNSTAPRRSFSQDAFIVGTVSEVEAIATILPAQKYDIVKTAGVYQLVHVQLRPHGQ